MEQLKYEIVKEAIREKIRNGVWTGGDRIDSERFLSEQHNVSRITAKRAVADLITEGTLVRISGRKGAFVQESIPKSLSSRLIGVAIDDISDTFGSELLRGIEDYFWGRKFHTLICNGDRDFTKIENYFYSLIEHNIAGLIFAPVIDDGYVKNNIRLLNFLQQHDIPYVLIDRYVPGKLTNYVGVNHRESAHQIVGALLERGHRRILLATGLYCTSMEERIQGYRDAYEEAQIEVDESLIIRSNDNLLFRNPDKEEVERLRGQIIEAGDFTCFYALNSRLLFTGVRILEEINQGSDGPVCIASHDVEQRPAIPYADSIIHSEYPCYQMGREAAKVLLDHVSNPDAPIMQMTLKASIVIPEQFQDG